MRTNRGESGQKTEQLRASIRNARLSSHLWGRVIASVLWGKKLLPHANYLLFMQLYTLVIYCHSRNYLHYLFATYGIINGTGQRPRRDCGGENPHQAVRASSDYPSFIR
jgi:hypothetical protein